MKRRTVHSVRPAHCETLELRTMPAALLASSAAESLKLKSPTVTAATINQQDAEQQIDAGHLKSQAEQKASAESSVTPAGLGKLDGVRTSGMNPRGQQANGWTQLEELTEDTIDADYTADGRQITVDMKKGDYVQLTDNEFIVVTPDNTVILVNIDEGTVLSVDSNGNRSTESDRVDITQPDSDDTGAPNGDEDGCDDECNGQDPGESDTDDASGETDQTDEGDDDSQDADDDADDDDDANDTDDTQADPAGESDEDAPGEDSPEDNETVRPADPDGDGHEPGTVDEDDVDLPREPGNSDPAEPGSDDDRKPGLVPGTDGDIDYGPDGAPVHQKLMLHPALIDAVFAGLGGDIDPQPLG